MFHAELSGRWGQQAALTLPPGESDAGSGVRGTSPDKAKETGEGTRAEGDVKRTEDGILANRDGKRGQAEKKRKKKDNKRSMTRAKSIPTTRGRPLSKRTNDAERPIAIQKESRFRVIFEGAGPAEPKIRGQAEGAEN